MSNFETIQSSELSNIVGGDGYNGGDVVRAGAGGLFGLLTGGPIGAVVGAGAGFMSRKVGELADGVNDLVRERARGQQLDAQREQLMRNRPPGR